MTKRKCCAQCVLRRWYGWCAICFLRTVSQSQPDNSFNIPALFRLDAAWNPLLGLLRHNILVLSLNDSADGTSHGRQRKPQESQNIGVFHAGCLSPRLKSDFRTTLFLSRMSVFLSAGPEMKAQVSEKRPGIQEPCLCLLVWRSPPDRRSHEMSAVALRTGEGRTAHETRSTCSEQR